jgi:restriction endonuclease Mrr
MAHAPAGDALPSESQLALPLLRELAAAGGRARPGELSDRIAATLGISDAARGATVVTNGRKTNAYQRRVRWVRQTLVARELIANDERGVWALTDRANAKLQNIIAGVIVTVFTTANGAFVWANASDTTALVERGSVDLLLCSPPYPC